MLSVIVPAYNAKDFLEQTIASLFKTTKNDFELIIIDDFSPDLRVKKFIQELNSPQVRITKIFNIEHKWTNYNWNLGVQLAQGEYIAILNSDITLSKDWDTYLMGLLKTSTIACPTEKGKGHLDPVIAKIDPNMIKGACFMFKKEDIGKLFPIPPVLKHWCGDNILADRANQVRGVSFCDEAIIQHFASSSAKTIDPTLYKRRILHDLESYHRLSDRNMKVIIDSITF
jgi:glycosyltransferase involved in cell wall biosynthesis